MANNLFINYDLNNEKNYGKVSDAIKSLGAWAKYQKSAWYVNSAHSATKAHDIVRAAMDADDSLMVVDSTNNMATWSGISQETAEFIKNQWYR